MNWTIRLANEVLDQLNALEGAVPVMWVVIGVYGLYLLPYIGASFYERYAFPLVRVKVLLVLWAVDRGLAIFSEPLRQSQK